MNAHSDDPKALEEKKNETRGNGVKQKIGDVEKALLEVWEHPADQDLFIRSEMQTLCCMLSWRGGNRGKLGR